MRPEAEDKIRERTIVDPGHESPQVRMTVRNSAYPSLQPLFQRGVSMEVRIGMSIKEFLCGELGLTPEYVDTSIQTIFLDSRAVDDLDSAVIGNGSTLALSAAMPGLLGATLRRGSFYASMRSQISYRSGDEANTSGAGRVTVKLFNLLLGELGTVLLKKGVWVRSGDLQALFRALPEKFWSAAIEAKINGSEIEPKSLGSMEWGEGKEVLLQVQTAD